MLLYDHNICRVPAEDVGGERGVDAGDEQQDDEGVDDRNHRRAQRRHNTVERPAYGMGGVRSGWWDGSWVKCMVCIYSAVTIRLSDLHEHIR